jgi:hypothetical protein
MDSEEQELKDIPEGFHEEEVVDDDIIDYALDPLDPLADKKKHDFEEEGPADIDTELIDYMHEGLYQD